MASQSSVGFVQVTPAKAEEWLLKVHPRQRPINKRHVRHLANCMFNHTFLSKLAVVMFDKRGYCINGQHTLKALIESGKTQNLPVMRGLSDDYMILADTAKPRSNSHRYYMKYGDHISPGEASILKVLDTPFNARKVDTSGYNDPHQVRTRQVRCTWGEWIDLYAGDDPLGPGGRPTIFKKAPCANIAAAGICAIRAYPHQNDDVRRWVHIAAFGCAPACEDQALDELETKTALYYYRLFSSKVRPERHFVMDDFRELIKLLWLFFEHDGAKNVPNQKVNPFSYLY